VHGTAYEWEPVIVVDGVEDERESRHYFMSCLAELQDRHAVTRSSRTSGGASTSGGGTRSRPLGRRGTGRAGASDARLGDVDFLPSSTAAIVADLAARSDDLSFELSSGATSLLRSTNQAQTACLPAPGDAPVLAYYRTRYRSRPLVGTIVCCAATLDVAKALLVLQAQAAFQAIDDRLGLRGYLTPGRGP